MAQQQPADTMPSQPEEATPTAPRDDAAPHSQPQEEAPPFPPPPILTLTKSILRATHPADAPAIQRAGNTAGVAKYMSLRFPSPYTLEDARFWVGYASAFRAPGRPDVLPLLAICDRATGTLLGGIGIKTREDVEAHSFELGYWIGEDGWGKGIMTEACRAYVKWVFETYPGASRLEAGVFEGNVASVKVLERSGFVHEGTRRKAGMKHGVVFDILVFGLLREECTW